MTKKPKNTRDAYDATHAFGDMAEAVELVDVLDSLAVVNDGLKLSGLQVRLIAGHIRERLERASTWIDGQGFTKGKAHA